MDILNCPWLGAATCALAALLNLHPVFGQVAKARKAEGPIVGLPAGTVLVQIEPLPSSAHSNRMLALWMLNPQKHSRFEGEVYTCPERTRGNYYSGPTRVSLVNTVSGEMINTVGVTIRPVTESGGKREEREEDSLDIPYLIRRDRYRVDAPGRGGEGKPTIINLSDYNASASCRVAPSAAQPGNSGTSATNAPSSSLQYQIISYFVIQSPRQFISDDYRANCFT